MAIPVQRRAPGGRVALLLLSGVAAALAAGQAFADPPLLARSAALLQPAAGPGNPMLRVLLQQATVIEARALRGPLRLRDDQNRERLLLAEGERLRISREGAMLRLERLDSSDATASAPLLLTVQSLRLEPVLASPLADAGSAPLLGLARRAYRGSLLVQPEGAALMALNLIPLETYLPSVVGSEMPARWPAAALRAQAVAARTYALAQRKPAAAYDLKATVASQAYHGLEAETESTRAAVAATRGMVLSHEGALINAVFHSSSGGSTENSGEIWNRQLPYLVSVSDADDPSPWREWSLRFEPEQLRRAFRETAGVRRIEVLSSSSSGRVRRARVIGPAGHLDLSGAELRQRLGLRSTLVRFRFEEPAAAAGRSEASEPAAEPPILGSAAGEASGPASWRRLFWQRAETGGARLEPGRLPAPPPAISTAVARAAASSAASPAPPLLLAPPQGLPVLEVVGRGFGHGVGMSQWGAYALALRGKDHAAILRHYYRGAELVPYAGR